MVRATDKPPSPIVEVRTGDHYHTILIEKHMHAEEDAQQGDSHATQARASAHRFGPAQCDRVVADSIERGCAGRERSVRCVGRRAAVSQYDNVGCARAGNIQPTGKPIYFGRDVC